METLINRANYELVTEFLCTLREDGPISELSIDRYKSYLRHLLLWANELSLTQAHTIRPTLSAYFDQIEQDQGKPLADETQKKIIGLSHRFFEWAKMSYATEFRSLPIQWVNRLKHTRRHTASVADDELSFVSLEDAITLATTLGADGDLAHWRDRAMAARLFLTAERASAAVTSPISAINFEKMSLKQWPELGVKTKNGKRATTFLLPIPELVAVARTWDEYVRAHLPPDAAWYAPIISRWGDQILSAEEPGKNRNIALNKRLNILFEQAGLPYQSAHKFRHGHAAYGLLHCQTMADYKALSLNLMHESLEITDSIYVHLRQNDQRDRIARLSAQTTNKPDEELQQYLEQLSKDDTLRAINILAKSLAK